MDDLLLVYMTFFSLQQGIGPNNRRLLVKVVIRVTMYLPMAEFKPTSSVFPRPVCYPLGYSYQLSLNSANGTSSGLSLDISRRN